MRALFAVAHESGAGRFCCKSPLMVAGSSDSIVVTRFAAEAGADGPTQAGPRATFLFILSRAGCSGRPPGPGDRSGARPFLGPRRACALLLAAGTPIDRSGADDPDAAHRLCFCDPIGAAAVP